MNTDRKIIALLATLSLLLLSGCADNTEESATDADRTQPQAQAPQARAAQDRAQERDAQDDGSETTYGDPARAGNIDAGERDSASDLRSNIDDIEAHIRLEARYAASDNLSALQIDTDVRDGTAYLSGEVGSDTERDLAEEEAADIEGIRAVRNDLRVIGDSEQATMGERLAATADDARITATVKARLLASDNTAGLQIDVDTDGQVVTLEGDVDDDAERELAGLIAANTSGVKDVRNQLDVNPD